jgi:hypothetical protein
LITAHNYSKLNKITRELPNPLRLIAVPTVIIATRRTMMKVTYTALAAGSNARGDKVCIVTGSDGSTMTLTLRNDGAVCDERNLPMGTRLAEDYKHLRQIMQASHAPAAPGYTAKTVTVERKGFMGLIGLIGLIGLPLAAKTMHQVIRPDGEVLRNCHTAELAAKVAHELNEFEASPPPLGDLQAEFVRIAGQ